MMDRRWTIKSEEAVARARGLARDKAHAQVSTGHLLAALFEADNFVSLYLQRLGSEPSRTLARVTAFIADLPTEGMSGRADQNSSLGEQANQNDSAELAAALDQAVRWADDLDDEYVSAENLLLGLATGDDDIALTLQAAGVGRGGWQGVIRLRRELWDRQVPARPKAPGFDPVVARVLVEASRRARAAGTVIEPAHVLEALVANAAQVGALLGALGLDASSVRQTAADIAGRATRVPEAVTMPVVSDSLHQSITAARRATRVHDTCVGPLPMLRGLAQDGGEVGELLRGLDELLTVLADRVAEPASRLAGAVMAQQRAMQQTDLETAARLLHGEIPVLEQEIEAMGPAEALLVRLLNDQLAPPADGDQSEEYEQFLGAVDTARTREVSRQLLRWLGERDVAPGDHVELAAFCATVHDGPITGREAGHAAGRLALLGLVARHDDAVRLTSAGLRCLEDFGGDPQTAA
ncbi:MAG: ATP-dependent Clp protease ATP-binding subunit ClpB [Micromonosporaceae bacterium]|nr:ATP-dependent Clp protease ATP-binding subunit ClpB [Micromonosporaceae bacterium]